MSGADGRQGLRRRDVLIAGAAAGLAMAAGPARAVGRTDPVVATKHGRVRGTVEDGILIFKGIRYGADTAPRRFQAPLPPAPWQDVAPATAFGPACPQKRIDEPTSEDCLFLNVWTPSPDPRAKRPVLVYIHGGAYASGSGSSPLTDGRRLAAAGDVVVVTLNHRLNLFGHAYLSRLFPEFPDAGNAGILDLLLALRWVRDNAAAFGGDPACVTVFGQSGGGAKIATLMGMQAAKGLFHRAFTMSGQQVTLSGPLHATRRTRAFLAALGPGADTADALRTMPVDRLLAGLDAVDPILGGGVYFGPVLDERHFDRHPFWPDAHPLSRDIPMVLGNTKDETRGFVRGPDDPLFALTWDDLPAKLADGMRVDILPEHVIAWYRQTFPTYSPSEVYFAATTAGRSWRGQVIEAEVRSAVDAPTWVYQLDLPSPMDGGRWGAFHTADIPLVFGTLDAPGSRSGTGPEARAASLVLQGALLALARIGDPNGSAAGTAGRPLWPQYRTPRRATLVVDAVSRIADDPRRAERELFAKVPYIQPGT